MVVYISESELKELVNKVKEEYTFDDPDDVGYIVDIVLQQLGIEVMEDKPVEPEKEKINES